MRSGEALAARRGEPRRRRRALAERSGDGPARGPARESQDELEEQILQGVSAASRKHTGWAGVLGRHDANRAENEGTRELGAEEAERSRQRQCRMLAELKSQLQVLYRWFTPGAWFNGRLLVQLSGSRQTGTKMPQNRASKTRSATRMVEVRDHFRKLGPPTRMPAPKSGTARCPGRCVRVAWAVGGDATRPSVTSRERASQKAD